MNQLILGDNLEVLKRLNRASFPITIIKVIESYNKCGIAVIFAV
jgi:hypothetical protein